MPIAAIPTVYKDVKFRSRLEARWAAFFDLCEWKWAYEPIDLPGWIPDFWLLRDPDPPLLVEVKPFRSWDGDTNPGDKDAIADALHKIRSAIVAAATVPYDVLYLGCEAPMPGEFSVTSVFGSVGLCFCHRGFHAVDDDVFLSVGPDDETDIAPVSLWTKGLLLPGVEVFGARRGSDLRSLWAESGNASQYKAPA